MRRGAALLAALALGAALTAPARPQQAPAPAAAPAAPAMLVADEVRLEGRDRLIAEGNVEALSDGVRMTASRIVYDARAERLEIDGPIRLTDAASNTVLVADSAALDRDLRAGLLRSARMVLDEQLQLAAAQIARVSGRYTVLSNTAVTSCQVCGRNEVPLWQIRARRVIHDQQERQLYFDEAQLRVLNLPVFYLPRLRLPDPTLKRARGFLIPSARSTSRLGVGLKLPYFVPLGPHQDITLTPYLSPKTRTLELRYRRAFARGGIQIDGAATRDTLRRDEWRGYLFADGAFALPREYRLEFDVETTTDEAYLNDYGYSGADRLASTLRLWRARRDEYAEAALVHYQSLRDDEDNATQPTIVGDVFYERRLFPARLGGEVRLGLQAHAHYRYSDADVQGRDVARLNAQMAWLRRWTGPAGLRLGVTGRLDVDRFALAQDSTSDARALAATPQAMAELRWPLARRGAGGAVDLLEPVAAIGWTGGERPDIADDESTRVELDEGNLLALSRFPAPDRRERGLRAAAALRWMHDAPSGWSGGLTLGRVWREQADPAFSRSSGLDGTASDWLIAGQLRTASGLTLLARGLASARDGVSKAEARAAWIDGRLNLAANYLLLVEDPAEDRPGTLSEWSFDGSYRIGRHWTGRAEWRYDLASNSAARAALGLQYTNECVEIAVSASRRYASSSNLEPSTDFGLTVALKGFSTGGSAKEYRRQCRS